MILGHEGTRFSVAVGMELLRELLVDNVLDLPNMSIHPEDVDSRLSCLSWQVIIPVP